MSQAVEFPPRSIFGHETETAVMNLRRKLRRFPWYSSVGTHGGKEQAGIIIYVFSDDHPEIDGKTTFRGFHLTVENIVKAGERAWDERLNLLLKWLP